MVVYENFFLKFSQNCVSKVRINKQFLIDNHYQTIIKSVRNACTSYRVYYILTVWHSLDCCLISPLKTFIIVIL